MLKVEIDEGSGFCFGVVNAIHQAEKELETDNSLYCLGDIVHNNLEVTRLGHLGLRTINHDQLNSLYNCKVLLRAHGEPPSTYNIARKNNIRIIDATCPVVLRLQQKIKACYGTLGKDTQLVIYGKKGHAEVNGLVGQTNGEAIVIEKVEDVELLDFDREVILFSQTTKPVDTFMEIVSAIKARINPDVRFLYFDTICRQVANRLPGIKAFASRHDYIYFVAGEKSSNGKMLFEECKKANPNTFFISRAGEITQKLPEGVSSVGVCGATSTPTWLMEQVASHIIQLNRPD